ncbi:PAS domain-containing protein [Roseococcus pinisoli]|uniref:histidine kinase n=1 Tax=Roseococcus pinisoli TaxID=2835040 RepID=A0ABS5QAW9_9PROT|nr:PAS domain-containing protein [Roseococcus pinisoli]MBS7810386.1 PAS domain-containing protein [Roseococcus pinisoli]
MKSGRTRKGIFRLPLAMRVFLGLIIALVPAGLVQVNMERDARRERTEQLGSQAMRLAGLIAREQSANVEAARQLLSAIAAHDAIRANRPSQDCNDFLARIIAANPRYAAATLLSPQGESVCSAHPEAVGNARLGDRPYLQAVMRENSFQIGEYAVGRGTGQPTLHLAAPLRNEVGEPMAVIVLGLSVRWMTENLSTTELPPGAVALVADRGYTVLARSLDPDRYIGTTLRPFPRDPQGSTTGMREMTGLDGVVRMVAYLPIREGPEGALFVSVGLESGPQMVEAAADDRRAAIMIVGSLLLTFLLALLGFHATIERPVRRLLTAAQRWREQDWSARVGPVGGGREFERLADAFDDMADNVQARMAERQAAVARMQAVIRVAPQVVLTADRKGRVDWVNGFWQQTTGLTEAQSMGDGWLAAVHPEDWAGADAAWRAAMAEARPVADAAFTREVRLRRAADRSWRWFLLHGGPIEDEGGGVSSWALVGVDFHEHREARAAIASGAAQLQATYETAPAALCLMDRELRFIALNEKLAQANGQPVAAHLGRHFSEMAPHVAADLEPALQMVLTTGKPVEEFELRVQLGGEERYWLCNFYPVRGGWGEVTGVSCAIIDITARKRVEASERMLSREVDHRAQNALSVVRGLIRLSAADAQDDVPALVEVLEGRIGAMSRAHNVLSREKWVGADLREIVRQELAPHADRSSMEGPPLRLTAEAAQPLTLVLHELANNAVKYGALSRPEGHVALHWERDAGGGVFLNWVERGGPPVLGTPERTGFGSLLIDANMRGQLAGGIERSWDPGGLRCVLTIGPPAVAGSAAPGTVSGAGPLTGRRVLVAGGDAVSALTIASALREAGCEVEGPAETVEGAIQLVEKAGRLDAAILAGTLAGRSVQPVAQLLLRRAATVLFLSPLAIPVEGLDDAPVLEQPITPARLRAALAAALEERRSDTPPGA